MNKKRVDTYFFISTLSFFKKFIKQKTKNVKDNRWCKSQKTPMQKYNIFDKCQIEL